MPGRTSTRQAAVKANEAFQTSHKPRGGTKKGGTKRKGSGQEETQAPPAKAKREEQPKEEKEEQEEHKVEKPQVEEKKEEQKEEKEGASEEKAQKRTPPKEEINETAVENSKEREEAVPSNILEKGIVYFFFRPRVSVEEPESIEDVARSFIVLRPLPRDAKLGEGPIGDDENCRLLVLPKKKLPTSSRERYMGFVEKAGVSVKTLRESFADREYETKTKGEQHVPPATPLAEGVYAITSTGRSSHLAYIITIPSELSEVQKDFGLTNRGSFIISAKNPKFPGPSSARLPKQPEYPQEIMDELRDLRWAPLQPKFIDYPNAQFLILGEAQGDLGKGGISEGEEGKESAGDEVEMLEHENEVRAYPLRGNDTVFDDLGMSMKEYPKIPTMWE